LITVGAAIKHAVDFLVLDAVFRRSGTDAFIGITHAARARPAVVEFAVRSKHYLTPAAGELSFWAGHWARMKSRSLFENNERLLIPVEGC
jgi:hypothetical protein